MAHALKTSGLLLLALLTTSAIVASAASAQGKLTSDGPVTLLMTDEGIAGAGQNAFTAFGAMSDCSGSTYTGHQHNVTPHTLIPSGATTFTMKASYGLCFGTFSKEQPATVKMNGCDFVVHIGGTIFSNTYAITTDIVCPGPEKIDIEVFTSITEATKICTLLIKPQNGLTGGHITSNPASDDLSITGTFSKVHVERQGLCTLDGKGTTTSEGKIDLKVTAQGINAAGGSTGVTVTD